MVAHHWLLRERDIQAREGHRDIPQPRRRRHDARDIGERGLDDVQPVRRTARGQIRLGESFEDGHSDACLLELLPHLGGGGDPPGEDPGPSHPVCLPQVGDERLVRLQLLLDRDEVWFPPNRGGCLLGGCSPGEVSVFVVDG